MPGYPRLRWTIRVVAVVASLFIVPIATSQSAAPGKATVKVMTYNVFQGTDFVGVLSAQTLEQYLAGADATLQEVVSSDPPARMRAIAHQIAITQPDLVGLQEMTLWRYDFGPSPTTVLYDPLQLLLDDLAAEGQHYTASVIVDEYELQGPVSDLAHFLRANGRNVLLTRIDNPDLQITDARTAPFEHLFQIPSAVLGDPVVVRGWGYVDATMHGVPFRFVVTHLENPIAQVPETFLLQQAQAMELNFGPGNTNLPLIIAGDFNAIANDLIDPSNRTYQEMLNFGFGDAWADRSATKPGLTWPLLNASTSDTATQRIDFVFFRGHVTPQDSRLAGDMKQDKVEGMWPSDHAGLRALLQVSAQ